MTFNRPGSEAGSGRPDGPESRAQIGPSQPKVVLGSVSAVWLGRSCKPPTQRFSMCSRSIMVLPHAMATKRRRVCASICEISGRLRQLRRLVFACDGRDIWRLCGDILRGRLVDVARNAILSFPVIQWRLSFDVTVVAKVLGRGCSDRADMQG